MTSLFSEFKHASAADWKSQLVKDLKGESPESLIWHNENGFDIQPLYSPEDIKTTYGPAFTHHDWEVCVKTKAGFAAENNRQLLLDLNRGATAFLTAAGVNDLDLLLNDIQLEHIHSTFVADARDIPALAGYLQTRQYLPVVNATFIPGTLKNQNDLEVWCAQFNAYGKHTGFRFATADLLAAHNAGAFDYYEIAMMCSLLNEYLGALTGSHLPSSAFVVRTGVNSNFFVQIAKLRAIRRLWAVLRREYGIKNDLHVIVETSLTNKSLSDSYNNLLRTTVEAMSAVAGGCNELVVNEFDALFPKSPALSGRMAINQQLILKEECYLDKMADVACGSYYIESLTDMLAQQAFGQFKQFEKQGGYFNCLGRDVFSAAIRQQAEQRNRNFTMGKTQVIGVNKYRNEKETVDLSADAREYISRLPINNAALNYELEKLTAQ